MTSFWPALQQRIASQIRSSHQQQRDASSAMQQVVNENENENENGVVAVVNVVDEDEEENEGSLLTSTRTAQQQQQMMMMISCADDLWNRIKRNELVELRLCWNDCNYITSPRMATLLDRALKLNQNSIRSLSIGYKLQCRRRKHVLNRLLLSVALHCRHQLTHLRLVLNESIPASTLQTLLHAQRNLQVIDIRSVQVHLPQPQPTAHKEPMLLPLPQQHLQQQQQPTPRNHRLLPRRTNKIRSVGQQQQQPAAADTLPSIRNRHQRRHHQIAAAYHKKKKRTLLQTIIHSSTKDKNKNNMNQQQQEQDEENVVTQVVAQALIQSTHANLKVLHLMDCNLTDEYAVQLADYLHITGGLAEVSLRSNRSLGPHGLAVLCQAPIMHKLDLSLCDLNATKAVALSVALGKRPWTLGELALSGNYRMGDCGLQALMLPTLCNKVVALNLSYCDVNDARFVIMMQALHFSLQRSLFGNSNCSAATSASTTRPVLRDLVLEGCRPASEAGMTALARLVSCNVGLRRLVIHDPASPKHLAADHLQLIANAMESNYELEQFQCDFMETAAEVHAWKQIHYHLRLNRAGRRILTSYPYRHKVPPQAAARAKTAAKAVVKAESSSPSSPRKLQYRRNDHCPSPSTMATTTTGIFSLCGGAHTTQGGFVAMHEPDRDDWFDVLDRAGQDLDILFWILRETAPYFHHFTRSHGGGSMIMTTTTTENTQAAMMTP